MIQIKLLPMKKMSAATSFKYQQPRFMAVKEGKRSDEPNVIKAKRWKVNKMVLLTWLIIIALTVVFWYLVLKLF